MATAADSMAFCSELGCVNSVQPGKDYCREHQPAADRGSSLKQTLGTEGSSKILAGPMAEELEDEDRENRRARTRSRGRSLGRGQAQAPLRRSQTHAGATTAEQTRDFWKSSGHDCLSIRCNNRRAHKSQYCEEHQFMDSRRGRSRTQTSQDAYKRARTPHQPKHGRGGSVTERPNLQRSKSRPARAGSSIFDRLADQRNFTKAYAARKADDRTEVNPDNFFQTFRGSSGNGRSRAAKKWNPTGNRGRQTFGNPLDGTVPTTGPEQRERGRSSASLQDGHHGGGSGGGSVFSRLTNSRSFTGVARLVHAEKANKGQPNGSFDHKTNAKRLLTKMLTDFSRVLRSSDPLVEEKERYHKLFTVLSPDDHSKFRSKITLTPEEKHALTEILERHIAVQARDRADPNVRALRTRSGDSEGPFAPSARDVVEDLKTSGPDKLDQMLRQIFRLDTLGEQYTLNPPRRAVNVEALTAYLFDGDRRATDQGAAVIYKLTVGDYSYIGKAGHSTSASSRVCAMVRAACFAGTDTDKSYELCQALRTTPIAEWRGEILVHDVDMTQSELEVEEQRQIVQHGTQWPRGLNVVVNLALLPAESAAAYEEAEVHDEGDAGEQHDGQDNGHDSSSDGGRGVAEQQDDVKELPSATEVPKGYEESVVDVDDEVSVLESVSEKPAGVPEEDEDAESDQDYDQTF